MIDAHQKQSGNVLFYILLAVLLVGSLTAMISRSGSNSNQTGGFEKDRVKASGILRYAKSVEQAVQQLVTNGISENDIDFLAIDAGHDNTNCTTADCEVFNRAGGGITHRTPAEALSLKSYAENWVVTAENRIYGFGCDDFTAGCTDIILIAPDIPEDICIAINKLQGITTSSGNIPDQLVFETGQYTGSITAGDTNALVGNPDEVTQAPEAKGKAAACIRADSIYHFYQVLLAR